MLAVLATIDFDAFAVTSRMPTRGRGRGGPRTQRGPRTTPASELEAAQRRLTNQLKDVSSAQQLLDILDGQLDGPTLDSVHISTAFTWLARHKASFDRAMQQSPVIKRLVVRVLGALAIDDLPA